MGTRYEDIRRIHLYLSALWQLGDGQDLQRHWHTSVRYWWRESRWIPNFILTTLDMKAWFLRPLSACTRHRIKIKKPLGKQTDTDTERLVPSTRLCILLGYSVWLLRNYRHCMSPTLLPFTRWLPFPKTDNTTVIKGGNEAHAVLDMLGRCVAKVRNTADVIVEARQVFLLIFWWSLCFPFIYHFKASHLNRFWSSGGRDMSYYPASGSHLTQHWLSRGGG